MRTDSSRRRRVAFFVLPVTDQPEEHGPDAAGTAPALHAGDAAPAAPDAPAAPA